MNKWLKIALGLCLFVVVAIVAAPKLLSTPTVKARVAAQLSDVLGMPVQLNGSSSVSLRPYLGVSWSDVTVGQNDDSMPLLTMDRLDAKLTLSAALFGDARLSELSLVRPVLRLVRDGQGTGNWQVADGQLGQWFAGQNDASVSLGRLMIVDGIALQDDATTRTSRKLTGLQGEIVWRNTASAVSASIGGIWNGEPFRITAQIDDPQAMRDGETSDMAFTLSASPIQLSFSGDVVRPGLTEEARSAGDLALETASPTRLREWLGFPPTPLDIIGETRIAGRLDLNASRADLADASINIDGQTGKGQLNLQWNREESPLLSGTLDFDTLALQNPFTAEQSLAELFGQSQGADQLELDLRVSAPTATVGTAAVSDLAAAILVQDGRTTIDIAQADTPAGALTGSVRLTPANIVNDAAATITANLGLTGTDFGKLSPNGPLRVSGTGNASLQLEASGTEPQTILANLDGNVVLDVGVGELRGLDAATLASARTGNSVDTGGATPFDTARVALFIVSGTAYLREGKFSNPDTDLEFGGRIDLEELTLALRGQAISKTAADAEPTTIFIGGTAAAPLLVPLPNRIAAPVEEAAEEPKAEPVESQ